MGQRGKGDSEAVKLKLWNTVAQFLDQEGHGYSHFGEQVLGEQGSARTMIWPQDKSRVGLLVLLFTVPIPLLGLIAQKTFLMT